MLMIIMVSLSGGQHVFLRKRCHYTLLQLVIGRRAKGAAVRNYTFKANRYQILTGTTVLSAIRIYCCGASILLILMHSIVPK